MIKTDGEIERKSKDSMLSDWMMMMMTMMMIMMMMDSHIALNISGSNSSVKVVRCWTTNAND